MAQLTYQSLMEEINKLAEQAKTLQVKEETAEIILDLREKIQNYNLTAVDLGLAKMVVHTRRKPDPKFRDPETGAIWTGRGKLPTWIKKSGKPKEEFLIK